MSQYQQLLLIASRDLPHSAATQRAKALATETGASLHVLGLVEPAGQSYIHQATAEHLKQYSRELTEVVGALRQNDVQVTSDAILMQDPIKDLLDYISELKPDLVIKDTHCESTFRRVFVTPFDCQLMRASPVPVHLVNQARRALPKLIVAAVDTSSSDQKLLDFNHDIIRAAATMALQCDAQLHLLHAYEISPAFIAEPGGTTDWVEELRAVLREPFIELADFYGVGTDRRHFVMGAPVAVIADLVDELEVDVVVMGIIQPKGVDKLMGDTTERTLNLSPCSVLTVKPKTP